MSPALGLLLGIAVALGVRAEMADEAYQSTQRLQTPQQRLRLAYEIEQQRLREQQAAQQAQQRQELERQQWMQQQAQRPRGAQLLEQRCAACHSPALVQQAQRGPLGWRWTVERMRWWHGAELQPGEAAELAAYLAATQGNEAMRQQEWLALLALAVTLTAWWGWRWQRRGQRLRR